MMSTIKEGSQDLREIELVLYAALLFIYSAVYLVNIQI